MSYLLAVLSRDSSPASPRIPRKPLRPTSIIPPASAPFQDPSTVRNRQEKANFISQTSDALRPLSRKHLSVKDRQSVPCHLDTKILERVKHGFVDIRPIMKHIEQEGLLQLKETYRNLALSCRQKAPKDESDIFSSVTSKFDRWSISVRHEIAAIILRIVAEGNYQNLSSKLLTRTEAFDGVYLETVSNSAEDKLKPFDLVYQISARGVHIMGLVVEKGNNQDFTGVPVLVMDWFDDYEGYGEMFHMGNIRNEMTRLYALGEINSPNSALTSAFSVLMTGDPGAKWELFKETQRNPLPIPNPALQSDRCQVATQYIASLRKKEILNDQQADIIEQGLSISEFWNNTRDEQRAQLNRILLVSGVPGCGKTYTAVYMITTFLLSFNPLFIRSNHIPYWLGCVFVLTKTNDALDVFLNRMESVNIPAADGSWENRAIPCFCKRSVAYLNRHGSHARLGKEQTDAIDKIKDIPVLLSTFGNLRNLSRLLMQAFGGYVEAQRWVAENIRVLIIDEGSQSVALDLAFFLMLYPSFNGIIVILGDDEQLGPVVFTNVEKAREYLSRSLFTEVRDARSDTGFIVPHAEMFIQYRMHRDIMNLANDISYDGKMVYGHAADYHDQKKLPQKVEVKLESGFLFNICLDPVVGYTTSNAPENLFQCHEYVNNDELLAACAIISGALSTGKYRPENIKFLSPYTNQCNAMKRLCNQLKQRIGVHTVTSFQGQETSLIIISLVRRSGGGVGFLNRRNMWSVALTRSIDRLVVIGDFTHLADSINNNTVWEEFLISMRKRRKDIRSAEELLPFAKELIAKS